MKPRFLCLAIVAATLSVAGLAQQTAPATLVTPFANQG